MSPDLRKAAREAVEGFDLIWGWMESEEPHRLERSGWQILRKRTDALRSALEINLDAVLAPTASKGRGSDPHTSTKAKDVASIRAGKAKHLLGQVFFDHPSGLTAEEAVVEAELTHQKSPWHRVSDLKAMGLIAPTGEVRLATSGAEAEVLMMTPEGREKWRERFID